MSNLDVIFKIPLPRGGLILPLSFPQALSTEFRVHWRGGCGRPARTGLRWSPGPMNSFFTVTAVETVGKEGGGQRMQAWMSQGLQGFLPARSDLILPLLKHLLWLPVALRKATKSCCIGLNSVSQNFPSTWKLRIWFYLNIESLQMSLR